MKKQGTVSFAVHNGNGGHKTFSLSWWQSVIALSAACAALFLGSSRAVAWVGSMQIHQWFDKDGLPRIEKVIDRKIGTHRLEVELRLQGVVNELRIEVEKLKVQKDLLVVQKEALTLQKVKLNENIKVVTIR